MKEKRLDYEQIEKDYMQRYHERRLREDEETYAQRYLERRLREYDNDTDWESDYERNCYSY